MGKLYKDAAKRKNTTIKHKSFSSCAKEHSLGYFSRAGTQVCLNLINGGLQYVAVLQGSLLILLVFNSQSAQPRDIVRMVLRGIAVA